MNLELRNRLAMALMALACLQVAGELPGLKALQGLAAAWGLSPRPKVFSDVEGFETFASEFVVAWDELGLPASLTITPRVYAQLKGPYMRRNVYGAALSYAPRMPESLWRPVYCYGMAKDGPLRKELGIPQGAENLRVGIRTLTAGREGSWLLKPECP